MGIQSGVMAQQFGMNFQFGKRKISAMSNEQFNKLTPEQMQADFSTMIKGLIPTFGDSLRDMRPFQRMIFEEMLAVFKTAIDLGIDVGVAGAEGIAHALGTHAVKHGKEEFPQDEHKFLSPLEVRAHKRHGHLKDKVIPRERGATSVGTVFSRTLQQAQADISRSKGTGIIGRGKKGAGQSQRLEKKRLTDDINSMLSSVLAFKRSGNIGRVEVINRLIRHKQVMLTNLLARYRF